MTFNPLKEKGISLDKQLRTWDDIVKRPYKREIVDQYTRTRQILMNGIEVEAWNFKHKLMCSIDNPDVKKLISETRRIEDSHQTTVNWLTPHNQSVLDTTLGYEQVAVDLTAWLAQNEPDNYVKETFNFGLLEDFDHLYRYSQFAYMMEGTNPNDILHYTTDVTFARPTQYHHNANYMRLRKHYDRELASPQTKVNILTLVSGEQQTHNYYAEHGFMYGSDDLRRLYAEIKDVEEEHVTMYETLSDPNETLLEKLLLHEFTEVCCYHNCYKDEVDTKIKMVWEEFLAMEIEHLQIAGKLIEKFEKRDPEEIIGNKVFDPCHFEEQKEYVNDVIYNEAGKRLSDGDNMGYTTVNELESNWASYSVQETVNADGSPSENAVQLCMTSLGSDISFCTPDMMKKRKDVLEDSFEPDYKAENTVMPKEYELADELLIFE